MIFNDPTKIAIPFHPNHFSPTNASFSAIKRVFCTHEPNFDTPKKSAITIFY